MKIKIKRVYDEVSKDDGTRILVDRIWPRGIKKDELKIDDWLKDIAPSTELRKWFAHDPDKWESFQKKYYSELKKKKPLLKELLKKSKKNLTLLYSAKDTERNQAVVIKKFLEKELI